MARQNYQTGFILVSRIQTSGLRWHPVKSGELIQRGNVCQLNAGYVADIANLQDITFCGVANSGCTAAEASSDGALDIAMIPPFMHNQFIVPCSATDLIALTQVGVRYDATTKNTIDENDSPTTYWALFVDAIDVSTEAVAVNTFGYAIGHFMLMPTV